MRKPIQELLLGCISSGVKRSAEILAFLDFKNGHTHTHKMLHLKIHLMAFEQKADNFTEKNQIKK